MREKPWNSGRHRLKYNPRFLNKKRLKNLGFSSLSFHTPVFYGPSHHIKICGHASLEHIRSPGYTCSTSCARHALLPRRSLRILAYRLRIMPHELRPTYLSPSTRKLNSPQRILRFRSHKLFLRKLFVPGVPQSDLLGRARSVGYRIPLDQPSALASIFVQ